MKDIADNLQMQEAEFAKTHKSDTVEELIVCLVKRLEAWNEVMKKSV